MNEPATISKQASPLVSMQYATLLANGITACQRLGGQQWTDYNEHDPGVTILEQLCYAITEASYRADLPMADLLAGAAPPGTLIPGDRILCTEPVTATDWRKLLVDRVPALRNAWIERRDGAAWGPLYRVLADVDDAAREPDPAAVAAQVRQVLASRRGLGEDVDEIVLLQPFALEVHGTLEIDPASAPDAVLAEALLAAEDCLAPALRVRPARDPAADPAAGTDYDVLFDGPLLDGVVDAVQAPVPARTAGIDALAAALLRVAGVTAVRDLALARPGATALLRAGALAIPDGHAVRLYPPLYRPPPAGASYGLRLICRGAPCAIDHAEVLQHVLRRAAADAHARLYARQQAHEDPYRHPPAGRRIDPGRYYSFQHHFPQVYGLGQAGIGGRGLRGQARLARAMHARQLKAYLLVFDQLLADYFAQVAHAWQLFSLDPALRQSYFVQPLVGEDADADDGAPPNVREWDLLRSAPAAAHGHAQGEEGASEHAAHHVVYLHAGRRHPEVLLRSREVVTLDQAHAIERAMLDCGRHPHRYRITQLISDQYQVVLDDTGGDPLAFGCERFDSPEMAANEAARLINLFRALTRDAGLARALLHVEARGQAGVALIDTLADGHAELLLSATHLTPAARRERVRALLKEGADERHYLVRPRRDGQARLFLCPEGNRALAQGEHLYPSPEAARAGARRCAELVARIAQDATARTSHLRLTPAAHDAHVHPHGGNAKAGLQHYRAGLAAIARRLDDFQARRNRFLDHLLARFGERLDSAALAGFDPRPDDRHAFQADLIGWKTALLRLCTGADGAPRAWDAAGHGSPGLASRSSLELRLYCLLGILGSGGWAQLDDPERLAPPAYRYGRVGPDEDADKPGNDFIVFHATQPNLFGELLAHGTVRANYTVQAHRTHHHHHHAQRYRILFTWPGAAEPLAIFEAETEAEAERAIARTIAYFGGCLDERARLYAGEELRLVEHVLLRPAHGGGTDAAHACRLSLFFPAWPVRFQNPAFRAFAAAVVAQECPAHMEARCHWLDEDAMTRLKLLHGDWMAHKHAAAASVAPAERHAALEHSARRLRECIAAIEAEEEDA